MKKKLFVLFVAVLIIACGFSYSDNQGMFRDLVIRSEVAESSTLPILSENSSVARIISENLITLPSWAAPAAWLK